MAETHEGQEKSSLSARLANYRSEVQRLVQAGAEHPQYEFKRECSLSRERLKERLDLVKLVQGLANSLPEEERFIVVGADQRERKFFGVDDTSEFDPAKLSQILAKYLEPTPIFEVFNSLETDDGIHFVLIVVSRTQQRPIIAKADQQETLGSAFLLRKGEIWMKENTALRPAGAHDLNKMYEARIEIEAEQRTRERVSHIREELLALRQIGQSGSRTLPTADLISGRDENFDIWLKDVFVAQDERSLLLLFEQFRDQLIEAWHNLDAYSPSVLADHDTFAVEVFQHKRDVFLPALSRLVKVGLFLVKHSGPRQWFDRVVELLVQIYDSSNRLEKLWFLGLTGDGHYVGGAMPALEAELAGRALAIYALRRKRFSYLERLLKCYVNRLRSTTRAPFLFWPIRGLPLDISEGMIRHCWETRVRTSWNAFFGNREEFITFGCELEFILELNSYLALGMAGQKAQDWFREFRSEVDFSYYPDLWQYKLDRVVPIGEIFLDALQRGTGNELFVYLLIEKTPFDLLFSQEATERRESFLAGYLRHLNKNQHEVMLRARRFPFITDWGNKLSPILAGPSSTTPPKAGSG